MSERSLERRFKEVTNTTIFRYIEDVRLNVARRLLETSDLPVQAIATKSGFGTAKTLRRAFARRLGVAPSDYRANFGMVRVAGEDVASVVGDVRMDLESVILGKSVW